MVLFEETFEVAGRLKRYVARGQSEIAPVTLPSDYLVRSSRIAGFGEPRSDARLAIYYSSLRNFTRT